MSPVPSTPIAARMATIQSRIAGIQGVMGFHGGGRLGPDGLFSNTLAAQVQAQVDARAETAAGTPLTPYSPVFPGSTPRPQAGPSAGPLPATTPFIRPGASGSPAYVRPSAQAPAAFQRPEVIDTALEPGSNFGQAVVALASRHLGTPYVWGGESLAEGGFDCSGLIQEAYAQAGIQIPRVSRDQARAGTAVPSLDLAIPGDLVAFGNPVDHIGIYAGEGMMVVAPRTGDVVKMQQITRTPSAIRRIVPEGTVVGAVQGSAVQGSAVQGATIAGGVPDSIPYAAEFNAAAARQGIDPQLLAAVARAESGYNPAAMSPAGARGLMQFMPATAREMGIDPMDPSQAIDGAARYLRTQLDTFGSIDLALAAYNAGPGNVRRHGGIPPFTETRNYVSRVLGFMGEMQ